MKYVILILVFIYYVKCHDEVTAQPTDPKWPEVFQQTFNEEFYFPLIGTHKTKGTYYYDFPNKRYRIDRENGRYDRYCGFNGIRAFQDTPCSQLVIDGMRWLIYPEKKDCCQCCTAAEGCGVLKPTWLSGAQFLGKENGNYKWNKKGLQDNFYYERVKDRVMIQINQVPNDIQYYDADSLKKTVDASVFQLPSYCISKKCGSVSACRFVGK